jgi:hypothetical protein
MSIKEIMHKYTAGEFTLEQANEALKNAGATFHLDPNKNTLSNEEIKMGFGLLDTGTGYMDKTLMIGDELVHADCGDMVAFFIQNGTTYKVHGSKLTAE